MFYQLNDISSCEWRSFCFSAISRHNENPPWYTSDSDSGGPNCIKTVVYAYYKLLKSAVTTLKYEP